MRDHPRLRGEYNRELEGKPPLKGSPPLARGIHNPSDIYRCSVGITPACAGNTGITERGVKR